MISACEQTEFGSVMHSFDLSGGGRRACSADDDLR
jgi:hypothetical protein